MPELFEEISEEDFYDALTQEIYQENLCEEEEKA
jgi:hypothetical protein